MQKSSLSNQNLPQLYRFCFLMLGDEAKALEIFQAIMHEAQNREHGHNRGGEGDHYEDGKGGVLESMAPPATEKNRL